MIDILKIIIAKTEWRQSIFTQPPFFVLCQFFFIDFGGSGIIPIDIPIALSMEFIVFFDNEHMYFGRPYLSIINRSSDITLICSVRAILLTPFIQKYTCMTRCFSSLLVVVGTTIVVLLLQFPTLFCTTTQGRSYPCSDPTGVPRSIQYTSPLLIQYFNISNPFIKH